ncbi:MAG: Mut7-C RNAse domain-containing protein [Gammaproteobacteria bacterium]|jgi:uncharacterized protein with PIN domain
MPGQVTIRFYEELNDFLPLNRRKIAFTHTFDQPGSIKDLIESLGVPHTEIDLILANGQSVDFDYRISDGDHISVYPVFESLDISPVIKLRPQPLREPRFVLDTHLGRLAAYLRMLGFDTLYRNDYDDPTLADISANEKRILLTCDRQLLMRRQVTRGYYVRERQPQKQLLEIVDRFDLHNNLQPFTRCLHCNGPVQRVDKHAIENHLLPRTKEYYNQFWQCAHCHKIYWKGSHYRRMRQLIDRLHTAS